MLDALKPFSHTLLKAANTYYIVERKRTVGDDIFEQVNRTYHAFEDNLRRNGTTPMKFKYVVFPSLSDRRILSSNSTLECKYLQMQLRSCNSERLLVYYL